MTFAERFALLYESGQVSTAAMEAASAVLTGVASHLGRSLDEEADAMAATHLLLAMERLARGEAVADPPNVLVEEARTYDVEWAAATALMEQAAARWGRTAPFAEIIYLTIHLRSLKGESA